MDQSDLNDEAQAKPMKFFKTYFLYAVGEILLVMIGILLAIKVNNINEDQKKKIAELQFYENFIAQIREDQDVISKTIAYNSSYQDQFLHAIQLIEQNDRSKVDSLSAIALKLTKYSDYDRESNIYESLVKSGELSLIQNRDIIHKIQILEESYIYFNRMEDIHYDLIRSIVPELVVNFKFKTGELMFPENIFNYRFQNIFITAVGVTSEKDAVYNRAIRQINELAELIEQEIELK